MYREAVIHLIYAPFEGWLRCVTSSLVFFFFFFFGGWGGVDNHPKPIIRVANHPLKVEGWLDHPLDMRQ
jgi:hypothetical protein